MPTTSGSPTLFLLVTLLIKLGVMASLASIIPRIGTFRNLLFIERRSIREKVLFSTFLGVPFMLGVLARLVARYQGTDLSLEITFVAGLLGGGVAGLMVGMLVHLPAVLLGEEILALPMLAIYALVGGLVRHVCPDKEEIWRYSPFIELSLYRSIKRWVTHRGMEWQVLFFLTAGALEIGRMWMGQYFPQGSLFYLKADGSFWAGFIIVLTTAIGVGLPLRIWNSTRVEHKLEEQNRLLMQSRVEALTSQMNPHFLFNTLNTISALTRTEPDRAREVLLKLSNILRGRLKSQVNLIPLRQELDFLNDYLDIEVVRFGKKKLQIYKNIEPETLPLVVPNMLLQPLVENALRHGIAPKIEGGILQIDAYQKQGRLHLRVKDNGVGIPPERRKIIFDSGIGIRNVLERLKVIYGEEFRFDVKSEPGRGTEISIEIPELNSLPGAQPAEVVAS